MSLSRRHFLRNSAATTLAFSGLAALAGCQRPYPAEQGYFNEVEGFGPLQVDPDALVACSRPAKHTIAFPEGRARGNLWHVLP